MSKTAQRKKSFHKLGIEDAKKGNPMMRQVDPKFSSYYKKGFTDQVKLDEGKISEELFNRRCKTVA